MFKIIKAILLTGIFFIIFLITNISFLMINPDFWIKSSGYFWSYAFYLELFLWSLFSAISVLCIYKTLGKFKKLSLFIPLIFTVIADMPGFMKFSTEIRLYVTLFIQLSLYFFVEWKIYRWLEKKEALKVLAIDKAA